MYKNRIFSILIELIILFSITNICYATEPTNNIDSKFHKPESLSIPEKNINLKIDNLTLGCEIYLMIPSELFEYNMQKFIENNIENEYMLQKQKAEKIKEYYDKKDYIGYIEYLKKEGFETEDTTIELRHYCFSINEALENMGYTEHNGLNYIKFKYNSKNSNFKIIMKDYLVDYDCSKVIFLIDEYGKETYIQVSEYPFVPNTEKSHINECNIIYTHHTDEDYEAINKAISISYSVIFAMIILIIITIIICKIIKYRKNKLEIQKRLFWKKK